MEDCKILNRNHGRRRTGGRREYRGAKQPITGNVAFEDGGGLLLHEYAEVKGCTIANNFAPKGDNIYIVGGLLKNTAMISSVGYNVQRRIKPPQPPCLTCPRKPCSS
jgi:hypothetical protein